MDEQDRKPTNAELRARIHERAEAIRAEDRARKGKPPKVETPEGELSRGQKIFGSVVGVLLVAGVLWYVHDRLPVVWAIGVVIAAIVAVSAIWHAVGGAVKRQ